MSDKSKTCPLCNAALNFMSGASFRGEWWQCPTPFVWSTLHKSTMITHYTLDVNNPDETAAEYIYIPPYRVKNINEKSIIHKLVKEKLEVISGIDQIDQTIIISGSNTFPYTHWKFIAETAIIKPEAEAKMLERIKVLLNFL